MLPANRSCPIESGRQNVSLTDSAVPTGLRQLDSYNNRIAVIEATLSIDFITLCFYGSESESTTPLHAMILGF
jgi:hypothetical protein